jgi:hypothetical protein
MMASAEATAVPTAEEAVPPASAAVGHEPQPEPEALADLEPEPESEPEPEPELESPELLTVTPSR